MKAHRRQELDQPDLLELLTLDDAEFRRRFAETPLRRAQRRGLLRNVCVALGNRGDLRAVEPLARYAEGPDSLLAEHPHWAIAQIRARPRAGAGHDGSTAVQG